MSDRGYRSGQVHRLTGLPVRTLDHWARVGFIKPSLMGPRGSGHDRLWSFTDLVALRAAVKLRAAGVSLPWLRRLADHIRARKGLEDNAAALAGVYLVTDGKNVFERSGTVLVDAFTGQGVLCVLPLGPVVNDLHRAIARQFPTSHQGARMTAS